MMMELSIMKDSDHHMLILKSEQATQELWLKKDQGNSNCITLMGVQLTQELWLKKNQGNSNCITLMGVQLTMYTMLRIINSLKIQLILMIQ